ncbi:MAG: DUF4838 domain-containing protein [Kiritimatiellia bacterium]
MLTLRLLQIVIVIAATTFSVLADVELVRDGKPAADIVTGPNPGIAVKWAALDLQAHLEKMSGAKLDILSAPSDKFKNHVYLGTSEETRKLNFKTAVFTNSGFQIVARDNCVILAGPDVLRKASRFMGPDGLKLWHEFCGEKFKYGRGGEGMGTFNTGLQMFTNDDPGTWYAVAELLEQLGVRFYAPYDDGTVMPEKKTISVAEQHLKKEAAFARREFCYYNAMRQDPDGIKWFKRIKLGNNSIIVYNHTTDDVFGQKEIKEKYPNFLAYDADGKPIGGYPAGHGMPRFTDPGFRKAAALYMNKRFEAVPEMTAMSMSPPDGGLKMDPRDLDKYGKPDDDVAQKTANYIWDFNVFLAKELKKAHPDKFLLYGSSGTGRGVPTNMEEFPDNMIVPFAQPYSAYRVLKSTDKQVIADRQQWFSKMKTIRKGPIWDYYLYYNSPDRARFPVFFTEHLQEEMQEMLPYSDGKFIEIQPGQYRVEGEKNPRSRLGVHGLIHLMVYWQSKLFWDPNADRKAMLEEYYDLFFGPAKAEMKEFHEFAEEVWCRQESRSVTPTTGFLKEKDVERYFEILNRARDKAGKDTVYDRRIAQMEGEMASLKTFFASLKRTGPKVEAHVYNGPVKIDGNIDKYPKEWLVPLKTHRGGAAVETNKTEIILAMTPDHSALIIGAICHENQMDKLKADCALKDTFSIFDDDVVEVYVNTPERSYFKVAVNPNNVIWDESTDATIVERDTLPILWNPGTQSAVKKYDDRWTVEIMVPARDLCSKPPSEATPWGIQVGRTRFTGGMGATAHSIAPADGPYRTLNKWGDLYVK